MFGYFRINEVTNFIKVLYWSFSYFESSVPSSSIPIEKSLQFSLFSNEETPACQAFLSIETNCFKFPVLSIKKWEETFKLDIFLKYWCLEISNLFRKKSSIFFAPNSPGGRLMQWITTRSIEVFKGLSSKFGEITFYASAIQPDLICIYYFWGQ